MPKYCIADLNIEITAPEWALDDSFRYFSSENAKTDIHCSVLFEKRPAVLPEGAKTVAEIPGKKIYEDKNNLHIFSWHEMDIPSYRVVAKDWSSCKVFIDPEYNNPASKDLVQSVKEGIFVYLREAFIGGLAQKNGVVIHSSSIIWQGEGVIFSAHSGTGKSTHAHLWQQKYGTPILDGDLAACRIVDGIPVIFGLPWCGTSGEFINKSVPLRAVVFLQQGSKNSIMRLDLYEAILHLTTRCILLSWNKELMTQYLDTIEEIVQKTDCYVLNCLPDFEAVELVKICLEKD